MKWTKTNQGNEIIEGDGFYVSYVSHKNNYWRGVSVFESDNASDETALYKPNADLDVKWRILNGDFRKEYEKLVPKGFDACVKFFDKMKKKHKSTWSSSNT